MKTEQELLECYNDVILPEHRLSGVHSTRYFVDTGGAFIYANLSNGFLKHMIAFGKSGRYFITGGLDSIVSVSYYLKTYHTDPDLTTLLALKYT